MEQVLTLLDLETYEEFSVSPLGEKDWKDIFPHMYAWQNFLFPTYNSPGLSEGEH